jgi:hypothetical protein
MERNSLLLLGGSIIAVGALAAYWEESARGRESVVSKNVSSHTIVGPSAYEVDNGSGEILSLICEDNEPAVAFLINGALRTQPGSSVLGSLITRSAFNKFELGKRADVLFLVYSSGENAGSAVLKATGEAAIEALTIVELGGSIEVGFSEPDGYQIAARFDVLSDDNARIKAVVEYCTASANDRPTD